jgi:hypothetical protein
MGKADTSVACSTLDNGPTGFHPQHCMGHIAHYAHSPTLLLRILNYADSSTVLTLPPVFWSSAFPWILDRVSSEVSQDRSMHI